MLDQDCKYYVSGMLHYRFLLSVWAGISYMRLIGDAVSVEGCSWAYELDTAGAGCLEMISDDHGSGRKFSLFDRYYGRQIGTATLVEELDADGVKKRHYVIVSEIWWDDGEWTMP